jgi:hypothetical protein
MKKAIHHLESRSIKYIVAGNRSTYSSFQEPISNNREEADTLMINTICLLQTINATVVVYSVDADAFVLLLLTAP